MYQKWGRVTCIIDLSARINYFIKREHMLTGLHIPSLKYFLCSDILLYYTIVSVCSPSLQDSQVIMPLGYSIPLETHV